jgi:hypothetical protein
MRNKSRRRFPVKIETADPLLTVEESAGVLRVSPHTLDKWRTYGGGPRYTRVGAGYAIAALTFRGSSTAARKFRLPPTLKKITGPLSALSEPGKDFGFPTSGQGMSGCSAQIKSCHRYVNASASLCAIAVLRPYASAVALTLANRVAVERANTALTLVASEPLEGAWRVRKRHLRPHSGQPEQRSFPDKTFQ